MLLAIDIPSRAQLLVLLNSAVLLLSLLVVLVNSKLVFPKMVKLMNTLFLFSLIVSFNWRYVVKAGAKTGMALLEAIDVIDPTTCPSDKPLRMPFKMYDRWY
jgi:hypothetical protein